MTRTLYSSRRVLIGGYSEGSRRFGLATLLKRMNKDDVTIAVDGSLFKLHPKYKKYMEKFISELAPGNKFQLILAEDGSGKGAGLVAAVVMSLDKSVLHE